jgi:hypothetical protein
VFYLYFFSYVTIFQIPNQNKNLEKSNPLLFVGTFVAICSMYYCLVETAKSIKQIELRRNVTFGDYLPVIFMICLLPISIWFLQPRINRILRTIEPPK